MIKLYILSIIFNLGCSYLSLQHLKSMKDKLKLNTNGTKQSKKEAKKLLRIIAIIPVINIIVGVGYVVIASGIIDDEIIKKFNEK